MTYRTSAPKAAVRPGGRCVSSLPPVRDTARTFRTAYRFCLVLIHRYSGAKGTRPLGLALSPSGSESAGDGARGGTHDLIVVSASLLAACRPVPRPENGRVAQLQSTGLISRRLRGQVPPRPPISQLHDARRAPSATESAGGGRTASSQRSESSHGTGNRCTSRAVELRPHAPIFQPDRIHAS